MREPTVVTMYTPGRCRVCGCTEDKPCELGANFLCWWVDAARTLCSAPKCLEVIPLSTVEWEYTVLCGEDPGIW